MPQNDILRRSIEAGISFTKLTRARAQEIAKELVRTGEIQRGQAQQWVDDLVERSRRSTEEMLEVVRSEVRKQVGQLRLASVDDVQKLLDRFAATTGLDNTALGKRLKSRSGKKAPAKKATPKKAAAKKTAAKKKAPAKKAAAPKSPAS